MSGAALDVEPDDTVAIDTHGIFLSLTQLASSDTPKVAEAIQRLLCSFNFDNTDPNAARKRHVQATVTHKDNPRTTEEERIAKDRNKTLGEEWQCTDCNEVFSSKSYFYRHINNKHSVKRRRLLQNEVFECDDCDCVFGTESALRNHEISHASCSDAPKSTKYKCALCDKERSGIYRHYKSVHMIEYPEQVLFYSGNVLVRSSMDTNGGKAPWFIREKENVTKRYMDITCRLCEDEPPLANKNTLKDHYTLYHMVDPEALNNLNSMFRAGKGSHLGFSAIQPNYSHNIASSPKQELPFSPRVKKTENGNIRWLCNLCDGTCSNKANLKRHVLTVHAAKHSGKAGKYAILCDYCDKVFDTEALLNKHRNDKHTIEAADGSVSKKNKCSLCPKEIVGIYKHYGNVHNIEYPEEIMIENGNVLVISNIYTGGGQAPWFKKEKAKLLNYKPSTCRLCDTEYENSVMLEQHYLSEHLVTPSALPGLQYMFRATKGVHLADLPASQIPSRRKHRVQSCTPRNNHRSSDSKSEIKWKASGFDAEHKNKKLIVQIEKKDISDLMMYQCEECEVATRTYDACVEHAQLHHLEDYTPITETCHICKLPFEPQCYAEHVSSHDHDTGRKILKYNPCNLLNVEWFNVFQGLPEAIANRITSSSVYKHTRAIKINTEQVAGIPLYQCGMCELYVHPKEVEEHCHNKNVCVGNKSHDYYCPECDIYFYTDVAITEHGKDHKNGRRINSFRKATFNCKQDATINRVLQEVQSDSRLLRQASAQNENVPRSEDEIPSGIQRENRPPIEILENRVVGVFCELCNKTIMYSEFETHAATHKTQGNRENEDDDPIMEEVEEESCLDSHNKKSVVLNVLSQNKEVMAVTSSEGTVEEWTSDNDSYDGVGNSTYDVEVEVHVQKEEVEEISQNNDEKLAHRNNECMNNLEDGIEEAREKDKSKIKIMLSSIFDEHNTQRENNDIFSEGMENDLKSDLQNILKELQSDASITSSAVDGNTTILDDDNEIGEFQQGNKNSDKSNKNEDTESQNVAISQDIFASDPSENQKGSNKDPNISMDIFRESIESPTHNIIVKSDTNNNEKSDENGSTTSVSITDIINLDTDEEDEDEDDATESNSRPSSKDILSRMLTDGDTDDRSADDRVRETERQRFIDETRRIRELMFSRD